MDAFPVMTKGSEDVKYMGTGICLFFSGKIGFGSLGPGITSKDLGTIRLEIVFDYSLTIRS